MHIRYNYTISGYLPEGAILLPWARAIEQFAIFPTGAQQVVN